MNHALKNLSLTFGIATLFASPAFAQVDPVKSILALQASQIEDLTKKFEDLKNHQVPVGTVNHSFLTLDQFQREAGGKWVPCDGRNVENTAYARVSGRNFVPNCAGRFLRATGGNAPALAEYQWDQLGSHAHSGSVDISHSHAHMGYTLWDINVTWTPGKHTNHAVLKRDSPNQIYHPTQGTMWKSFNTTAIGGNETRPVNIAVGMYVKVDY